MAVDRQGLSMDSSVWKGSIQQILPVFAGNTPGGFSLFLRASLSCATIIEGCSIMIDGYPAFCVNIEKGLLKQSFLLIF